MKKQKQKSRSSILTETVLPGAVASLREVAFASAIQELQHPHYKGC